MTIEFINEDGGTRIIGPGTQEVVKMLDGSENTFFRVVEVVDPDTVDLFTTGMVYQKPDKVEQISREQITNHPELNGRMRWVQ